MAPLANFLYYIVNGVLWLVLLALIITAIMSWLVAFNVINLRNPTVARFYDALQRFVEPMVRPIRRFVPPLGGVDLSFLILFLIIRGAQLFLIGPLFGALAGL